MGGLFGRDPLEDVAAVASARRDLLLRVHRFRLRREDLEDAYSQATLELLAHVRRGGRFANWRHLAAVLEQRFLARVHDHRRALSGRSPMLAALETAVPLGAGEHAGVEPEDGRSDVERTVIARQELRRVASHARSLSGDQRMVLAWQLAGEEGCAAFCARYGWSSEKYRKVAQRARARLRAEMELDERHAGVPSALAPSERVARPAHEHQAPHS